MVLTREQVDEQRKQAEELLFSGPQALGFAKSLYFGHFQSSLLWPYPEIDPKDTPRRGPGGGRRQTLLCRTHRCASH